MKKEYKKPQIIYESFELSQSIAAGCEFVSSAMRGMCPVMTDLGFSVFITSYGCDYTPPNEDDDMLCYDVPSDSSQVYSS